MERKWWHNSAVYQIYPRSFYDSNGDGIGDIQGIIRKLDYIKDLGAGIIWLSPVYKSPMADNGYDVSDYYSIAPEFGTLDDMDLLIKEAGIRGMSVMMDMVINHTSDEHPWFVESRKSRHNPRSSWYIWKDPAPDGGPPNNWGSFFSESAWEYCGERGQYYLHLFSRKQPDLNWANSEVREAVYSMMRWWLDRGVRGLRLDAVDLLSKPDDFRDGDESMPVTGMEHWMNGPEIHNYLKEMYRNVFSGRNIVTVGETSSADVDSAVKYTSQSSRELDMIFQFEHMFVDSRESVKWKRIPLDLVRLKEVFSRWQKGLYGKGWNSLYWNNHDQPRAVSRFGSDEPDYREKSAKMLAAAMYMMQGTPFIYQGEELGMTNTEFHSIEEINDIDSVNYYNTAVNELGLPEADVLKQINISGRDNARTPIPWSPDKNGGFTSGTPWIKINQSYMTINVKDVLSNRDSVFFYYRKLLDLRRNSEFSDVLAYGRYEPLYESDPDIFAYLRCFEDKRLLVICNFFSRNTVFSIPDNLSGYSISVLMSNYTVDSFYSPIELRPYECFVLSLT